MESNTRQRCLCKTGLSAEGLSLFGVQFIRRGNYGGPRTKQPSDFRVNVCFSTSGRGAVKTVQTQLLTVQMCRQLLKEGGVDCDRNMTGAPNQHMDTAEVKEGQIKAEVLESSSTSHHTLQTSSICFFFYEARPSGNKTCFNGSNRHFTDYVRTGMLWPRLREETRAEK